MAQGNKVSRCELVPALVLNADRNAKYLRNARKGHHSSQLSLHHGLRLLCPSLPLKNIPWMAMAEPRPDQTGAHSIMLFA